MNCLVARSFLSALDPEVRKEIVKELIKDIKITKLNNVDSDCHQPNGIHDDGRYDLGGEEYIFIFVSQEEQDEWLITQLINNMNGIQNDIEGQQIYRMKEDNYIPVDHKIYQEYIDAGTFPACTCVSDNDIPSHMRKKWTREEVIYHFHNDKHQWGEYYYCTYLGRYECVFIMPN